MNVERIQYLEPILGNTRNNFVDVSPAAPFPVQVITGSLATGAATEAKQDELQGVQGTGASYDPPTGGSGLFGWMSGIYKEISSGIKLKLGGADVSSSNPLPVNSPPDSKTSNTKAALEGVIAKCWINCPAVAAKFSAVQIWNPVGSGVNLLVIGLNGMNASGTMKWFQHLDATKISTLDGYQQNLKAGNAALPFEMYYQNLDSKTATNALGVTVSAVTVQGGGLIMSGENICITEGYGLRYEADTANISITMFATIIASSNA